MTTLSYVFYASLVGMFGMILVKMYEVRLRRRSFIYKLFANFDEITHGLLAKIFVNFKAKKQEFDDFVKTDFKEHMYQVAVKGLAHLRESYDKIRESARGVQKLKENPRVSAFLRDIEEAKKEISEKNGASISTEKDKIE